jgi:CTP synthase (UTP-ammonia lyase)
MNGQLRTDRTRIAIVGDFDPANKTHLALNQSLYWLNLSGELEYEWIDTVRVEEKGESILDPFSGIWSAPGSPFKSLAGALEAIRYARVNNVPHLGTCAGFQHSIVEFARNVLMIPGAQHEEYDDKSSELFISRLACSLVGKSMTLNVIEKTKAFDCYGSTVATEDYYCNFGVNPGFRDALVHPDFSISGVDRENEIRIIELPKNDFFMATLFVPQTRATKDVPHPIISSFVLACSRRVLA